MFFSILYFLLRLVLRIAPADDSREREAEILVLRHQLSVLKRQNPRPKLRRRDRMMLAGAKARPFLERFPKGSSRCHLGD